MEPDRKPELLAPAGSTRAVYAALKNGADAVYLGASSFGARSSAGFSDAELCEITELVHLHRKRVYVTVNTLIKENELDDACNLLVRLDKMGADAVILQDLGLVSYVRQASLAIPIHASTQMSVHNAAGASLAKSLGFSRVVAARECSIDTLRKIAHTGIETEVFVHGALCVSVSGQCLMSSQIGGRSGNRGRCAQPCRMQYNYRGKQGSWLSPRDLLALDMLPRIIEAGASSFKIEGRLKSPEYVATAVRAYRQAIDACLEGRAFSQIDEHKRILAQVFSRGGFTRGLMEGRGNVRYINPLRVSHEGLCIGEITSCHRKGQVFLSQAKLTADLHNGDHLQIRGAGGEQELIYAGPEVQAGQVATLRQHKPADRGASVHRLLDSKIMGAAGMSIDTPFSPIPLLASLTLRAGEKAVLELRDDEENCVSVHGDTVQLARSAALSIENSRTSIAKFGTSPFVLRRFDYHAVGEVFLPVSSLNSLRRDALSKMKEQRIAAYQRVKAAIYHSEERRYIVDASERLEEGLYVRSDNLLLGESLLKAGADYLLYSPQDYTNSNLKKELQQLGAHGYFCLPRQCDDDTLTRLHHIVCETGVSVLLDNVSQLNLAWPAGVLTGDGIPVWNSRAREYLTQRSVRGFIMSAELRLDELVGLMMQGDAPTPIHRVYGRVVAMLLNHCPERTRRQLDGSHTACHLCEVGQGTHGQALVDSFGASYPLMPIRLPDGCLNRLMFHTPLNLSKKALGNSWLCDFTDEGVEDALRITSYYVQLLRNPDAKQSEPAPLYTGRLADGVM